MSGGGSSNISGSNQGQQSSNTASSSGFTNINRYIEENQPQTTALSNKVAGNITEKFNTADNSLNEADTQFNDYFNQNTPQDNGVLEQAETDYVGIANDEEKFNNFTQLRDAEYTGASAFGDTDYAAPILGYINDAQGYSNINDNQNTRVRALEDVQQNDAAGITSLNNLLLQNNNVSRETLGNAAAPIAGLQDKYDTVNSTFNQRAQDSNNQAQEYRQRVNDMFYGDNGHVNQFTSGIDERVNQQRTEAQSNSDRLTSLLSSINQAGNELNEQDLSMLGITPEQYASLQNNQRLLGRGGVDYVQEADTTTDPNGPYTGTVTEAKKIGQNRAIDLRDYLSTQSPDAQITRDNVASLEDYARQDALQKLLGQDLNFLGNRDFAGQSSTDLIDFDYEGANRAIQDILARALKEGL